VANFNQTYT